MLQLLSSTPRPISGANYNQWVKIMQKQNVFISALSNNCMNVYLFSYKVKTGKSFNFYTEEIPALSKISAVVGFFREAGQLSKIQDLKITLK